LLICRLVGELCRKCAARLSNAEGCNIAPKAGRRMAAQFCATDAALRRSGQCFGLKPEGKTLGGETVQGPGAEMRRGKEHARLFTERSARTDVASRAWRNRGTR
jgi:hypothetical protein